MTRGAPNLDHGLEPDRLVDLTRPLGPGTIHWPGTPPFEAEIEGSLDSDGEYTRTLRLAEHSRTHLDAPAISQATSDRRRPDARPTDPAKSFVERRAVGIGIDSMGIDPGYATDFPANQVTFQRGARGSLPRSHPS